MATKWRRLLIYKVRQDMKKEKTLSEWEKKLSLTIEITSGQTIDYPSSHGFSCISNNC